MQYDPTTFFAPELRIPQWIDAAGQPRAPLKLADLGGGFKVIYCFQHWCPGCHSVGFPTLRKLVDALSDKGFCFAAVQTVFEGADVNTFERLRETQERHGLVIPFGHDPAAGGSPTVISDYGTRGTPWFIVIDPMGEVVFSDFQLDGDRLVRSFGELESAPIGTAEEASI